jgi:polar amino acid transport system substrate-binding protein
MRIRDGDIGLVTQTSAASSNGSHRLLNRRLRRAAITAAAIACLLACAGPVSAQTKPPAPDVGASDTIAPPASDEAAGPVRSIMRFVTDSDYPPFNYYDEEGNLTGFNVDVARAVCFELELGCDIQAAEWKGLLPVLQRGEADAVIASLAVTPGTLAQADFTTGYYVMAGRFVAKKATEPLEISPLGLEGRKVGVVDGSAHAAYLDVFFRDVIVTGFPSEDAAREALTRGDVDLLFGDGIGLMFWINGASAGACCEYRGGPYYDPRYFGDGVGIAVRKGDHETRDLLEKGLAKVRSSGRFEELLQRYFPFKLF